MGKRVYRVKKGDDFIKISRKLYGNASYVMDLMRANPGFNRVGPGMVLRLPKMDPRITRQRKIKRRLKKYGPPPPEETEDTTAQGIPTADETGYSEDSGANLSQNGSSLGVLDDPAFLDEVANTIAETAAQMGLNEEVMLDELGLGEGSPLLPETSTTEPAKSKTEKGNLHSPRTSRDRGPQSQTGESSQAMTESTTPPVTLTDEQIDALKANLEKMGLDVDVAMEELGLGEGAAASTTASQTTDTGVDGGDDGKDSPGGKVARPAEPDEPPPPETPKDMVDLLDTVESEEELEQWREILANMNLKPEVLHGLEYMAAKKEKELEDRGNTASQTTGVSTGTLPPPPTPKPEGNTPEENMYINLYNVKTEKELQAWKELLSRMGFNEENMQGFLELASIKERELNSSRKNPFKNTVIPLAGFEDVIIPSFQYQFDTTETTDNDCTEASIAMLINMMLKKYDPSSKDIHFSDLARDMDKHWWKFYRTTADFKLPIIGPLPGLTPPFGARNYLQNYGKSHEPGWIADLSTYSTTDALLQNIMDGKPTMIYGVDDGTPHAVVPVGFDTATKKWIILNPGTDPGGNPQIYEEWLTQDLEKFWNDNLLEGWLPVYNPRTMITLYPNS